MMQHRVFGLSLILFLSQMMLINFCLLLSSSTSYAASLTTEESNVTSPIEWFNQIANTTQPIGRKQRGESVILLHGLIRKPSSMNKMAKVLSAQGYHVCNIGYPSREHDIATLAKNYVAPKIHTCLSQPNQTVHFVTHSLGGIIVRELARTGAINISGRVVMLGPPNHGSQIVDKIGHWRLFDKLNGKAGQELSTAAHSTPNQLGEPSFELGVIAGDRSINWINSMLISGADDGKVAVDSTKLENMMDFIVLHTTHPLMMKNNKVINQSLYFIQHGRFNHAEN